MEPMTREDYDEMVKGPGKFEGEPAWAPYFYELALDGGGDDQETTDADVVVDIFHPTPEDVALFPELAGVREVRLWEDGNGFAYTETVDREG